MSRPINCRDLIAVGAWKAGDCCHECHGEAQAGLDLQDFLDEEGDVIGQVCCSAIYCTPNPEQYDALKELADEA